MALSEEYDEESISNTLPVRFLTLAVPLNYRHQQIDTYAAMQVGPGFQLTTANLLNFPDSFKLQARVFKPERNTQSVQSECWLISSCASSQFFHL